VAERESPLAAELRPLLEAERARPGPPRAVEARVFKALAHTLTAGAGSGGMTGTSAAARLVVRWSRKVSLFLLGAVTGAGVHAGVQALRASRAPPRPTLVAAMPTPPPVASPHPRVAVAPPPSVPSSTRPRGSAERDRALAAERRLLEVARSALGRGQPATALDSLERHARAFPHGALAEEREALRVQCLVARGDAAGARTLGARFRQLYPDSILRPTVEAALRSIP
jgi:hypothetical protein